MSVSYPKDMRAKAKEMGWPLCTIAVPGCEFQGPVSPDERDALVEWMQAFFQRRYNAVRTEDRP